MAMGAFGFEIYYDPAILGVSESEESKRNAAVADVTSLVARGDDPEIIVLAGFETDPP